MEFRTSSSPLVTMIIRFEPVGKSAERFIQSLLAQKYESLEIILLAPSDAVLGLWASFREAIKKRGWIFRIQDTKEFLKNKAPFQQINGEYVCFPEMNSILDKKFVLSLARNLSNNPDMDGVRCNGVYVDEQKTEFVIDSLCDAMPVGERQLFWALMTRNTPINISLWMMRTSKIQTVDASELSLDRQRWNWQFVLPWAQRFSIMSTNINLLKLLHISEKPDGEKILKYDTKLDLIDAFFNAGDQVLSNMALSVPQLKNSRSILRLRWLLDHTYLDQRFRLWQRFDDHWQTLIDWFAAFGIDLAEKVEPCVNEHLSTQKIKGILIEYLGNLALRENMITEGGEAFVNKLNLGFNQLKNQIDFVMYGAGAAAKELLEVFLALGQRPHSIWDRNAQRDQKLLGIPVIQPPLGAIQESIDPDKPIAVALGRRAVAQEVHDILREKGFNNIHHIADRQGVIQYIMASEIELKAQNSSLEKECWHVV